MKSKRGKYERKPNGDENNILPSYITETKMKRSCLMCGKMFNSKGAGNRRCPTCARSSLVYSNEEGGACKIYRVYLPETNHQLKL